VNLIVLGACGSWPDQGTALSGYLIQHEGFNLWVDCGSGTMANLQRHITIADVDAMIITHEHADHCVDVYPLFYARFYNRQGADGMPLYIPKGFRERMMSLLSDESIEGFGVGFDVHEVTPNEQFDIGPFKVASHAMSHLGLPALGFRIAADGVTIAYTGDTGPAPEVVELAKDADVFMAEATYQDTDTLTAFHLSARQAGEAARDAGAGRLILTHLLPSHDKERSKAEAADEFDGRIDVALEGLMFEIGNNRAAPTQTHTSS
jgi:ribonuclease BN (tRNA processing enzyme)